MTFNKNSYEGKCTIFCLYHFELIAVLIILQCKIIYSVPRFCVQDSTVSDPLFCSLTPGVNDVWFLTWNSCYFSSAPAFLMWYFNWISKAVYSDLYLDSVLFQLYFPDMHFINLRPVTKQNYKQDWLQFWGYAFKIKY